MLVQNPHNIIVTITLLLISICIPVHASTQHIKDPAIHQELAELEATSGGRIGVHAINTANHTILQYRSQERFPFCSTGKIMAVSAVLKQSMENSHLLQKKVIYNQENLAGYSPITKNHLTQGMTIAELCAAAIMFSDNTAMNLLIKNIGGPASVNAFAHSIGDNAFRLDRFEPELNSAIPGDLRDTSTPAAMSNSLQQLTIGNALAFPQKEQLLSWLKKNTTGNNRIRAGVPAGWVVGDKTGTGDYGTTNDVGVIWPKKCPPIVVAIYFTQNKQDAVPRDDVLASVTRILIRAFAKTDECVRLNLSSGAGLT